MTKQINRLTVFFLLTSLLLVAGVSAHGSGDDNTDHDRRGHRSGHTPPMAGPGGFSGQYGNMKISGELSVTDSIIIEFTVTPSQEARDHMQDRPHRMPGQHGNMDHMTEDLTNTVTVKIPQLVEYIDIDDNGYSSNDTILSIYSLNATTLEDPEIDTNENGTVYTIESVDHVFIMYLYLNENDGIPHSWKWSLELNAYPFESETSAIALLHSIESNGGHPMSPPHDGNHGNHMGGSPPEGMIHDHQIRDDHEQMPMYFKWDPTAIVDDTVRNVTASFTDDMIAISIPQGQSIFYDPEIGLEVENIESANDYLSTALQDFGDTINSPTILGITLGMFLIGITVIITRYRQ